SRPPEVASNCKRETSKAAVRRPHYVSDINFITRHPPEFPTPAVDEFDSHGIVSPSESFLADVSVALMVNQTCLSKGCGYHIPPCHVLEDVHGFRILLDCPLDLSVLSVFSPVLYDGQTMDAKEREIHKRQKADKPLEGRDLIRDEPWYKTAKNLHLWDPSSIDVVLISSVMGMLGLPFLTRVQGFCAKIYVTDAAARLAQLMMEDLVSMNSEFLYFYGPRESGGPPWMRWEELELLHPKLKELVVGKDGTELAGWVPLYSSADVMDCMQKVQRLKYAEAACYNGTLVFKPFSSGSEIGSCNWTIDGPKTEISWISCSVFVSAHAMEFDYNPLRGRDLVIYSDMQCQPAMDSVRGNDASSAISNGDLEMAEEASLSTDESLEEKEKITFILSCILQSVQASGSVVIPFNRLGILLQLLEEIPKFLESLETDVPIYFISSIAAELLAFMNTIPEWVCKPRQEKASKISGLLQLFSGEAMFSHGDLVKSKKLHVFSAIHSPELLTTWQEPCIVFAPHWSLRLGPVVHLLRRWSGNENSLLVLEDGIDACIALLPFKPVEMKVLQCSFLPERRLQQTESLLKALQPKTLVLPDDLKQKLQLSNSSSQPSPTLLYFTEGEILSLPSSSEGSMDLEIASELATKFAWQNLEQQHGVMNNITRLEGELLMQHGKYRLIQTVFDSSSEEKRPLLLHGTMVEKLLMLLSDKGIDGSVEQDHSSGSVTTIDIRKPKIASIQVSGKSIVVTPPDEEISSLISEAISMVNVR
ncbi:Integrator complex subunit 9 homolog, partial [Linum perenne]